MKFAAVFLLACICVGYVSSVTVTTWGDVKRTQMGEHNVVTKSSMWQVQKNTFTYPKGSALYPIYGIKHIDFKSHPVNTTILNGGVGSRNVTFHLESQRGHGINSTFYFYV